MTFALDHGLVGPSRKRLFACVVYEALLLFGVLFIAGYLFDTLTQSHSGLTLRHQRQAWLTLVLGVYFVWFWTHGGQTLAMKTWHIKLVNSAGNPVGMTTAVIRFALALFLTPTGLSFVYSWIDRQGQFPHDRLLDTRLVISQPTRRGVESVLRSESEHAENSSSPT
ncbi:RDD family protein [Limnobacter sp.]|uniref:RDD family protein n=1 Tax=Limnobacter sp. TaxID=2003368 RepID=UPI00258C2A4E|nr:RDD family protein [Limnobacter sp.]